jgi:hypothetical protein
MTSSGSNACRADLSRALTEPSKRGQQVDRAQPDPPRPNQQAERAEVGGLGAWVAYNNLRRSSRSTITPAHGDKWSIGPKRTAGVGPRILPDRTRPGREATGRWSAYRCRTPRSAGRRRAAVALGVDVVVSGRSQGNGRPAELTAGRPLPTPSARELSPGLRASGAPCRRPAPSGKRCPGCPR